MSPAASTRWQFGVSAISADSASILASPLDGHGELPMVTITATSAPDGTLRITLGPCPDAVVGDDDNADAITVTVPVPARWVEDRCSICDEHIANPHGPGCPCGDPA